MIMLAKMMKDIAVFLGVFVLFLTSFTVAFLSISGGEQRRQYPDGVLTLGIWATVGEFGDAFDYFNSEPLGPFLLGIYLGLSNST